jgi:multidrug resistance efflux pump
VLAGASTYAVGAVATEYFKSGVDLSDVDLKKAKERFKEEFAKGKQYASDLQKEKESSETYKAAIEALANLEKLKEGGVITEEEFETLKQKLLERM